MRIEPAFFVGSLLGRPPYPPAGLATIMLLAIGFHVCRHESPAAPVILFLLAVFVVFGRFSHWTLVEEPEDVGAEGKRRTYSRSR
jgi:hypothetical protein